MLQRWHILFRWLVERCGRSSSETHIPASSRPWWHFEPKSRSVRQANTEDNLSSINRISLYRLECSSPTIQLFFRNLISLSLSTMATSSSPAHSRNSRRKMDTFQHFWLNTPTTSKEVISILCKLLIFLHNFPRTYNLESSTFFMFFQMIRILKQNKLLLVVKIKKMGTYYSIPTFSFHISRRMKVSFYHNFRNSHGEPNTSPSFNAKLIEEELLETTTVSNWFPV